MYKVNILGFGEKFNGVRNYVALLSGKGFPNAVGNTFALTMLSLFVIPFGFILATALYSLGIGKTQSLFRVMFYMPNIITGVSVVLIMQYVFLKDGGLLNTALSNILGRSVAVGWLTDSSVAKYTVSIMSVWGGLGYAMLINLAGLQSVPSEIYESASIDGCNAMQRWLHITIPNMTATFSFLFITSVIGGFSRFTDLFILGGNSAAGKPGGSLQTILMYIYQFSFESPNYGLSAAGSMILFAMVLVVTLINLRLTGFYKND
ncbi:MAG: sugar ABC transporter permease, partial [Clostridiales bacterium]|nr:sugar ABC transporter permease [Clostridiales bacterium]